MAAGVVAGGVALAGAGAGVVVVPVVVVVGGVAGDQDPGDGPVTGQPPTRLGVQGPGVSIAAQLGAALEAVQVHRHQQLGPHPTGLGQPATLQGAAGQLAQGIGPALPAAAGVGGAGGAGQGFQGCQQGLAGFGLQQAIDRDHAVQGG